MQSLKILYNTLNKSQFEKILIKATWNSPEAIIKKKYLFFLEQALK